jgi:pyruvate,orthophosphate dikinase
MGKPCIVGCAGLAVDPAGQGARIGGVGIKEGDWLSIDGETGTIYLGRANLVSERPEREIAEVESWRAEAAGPSMSEAG